MDMSATEWRAPSHEHRPVPRRRPALRRGDAAVGRHRLPRARRHGPAGQGARHRASRRAHHHRRHDGDGAGRRRDRDADARDGAARRRCLAHRGARAAGADEQARPDGRGAGGRDRRHRGHARAAFPAADRALDGGRLGVLFLSQRRRPAGDRGCRRRRWPRPDGAHPAVAQGVQPVRHDRALRRARLGRLLPDRAGLRRARLRARPCGGLHLVGAVPGAGLPAGRGPARPRAAPDDGRHRPAVLRACC